MARTSKLWRYSAGRRPYTVAIEEFEPGGNLYARIWVPAEKTHRYRSLRHKDRKRAIEYAERMSAKLRDGCEGMFKPDPTLPELFRLYVEHRTPQKAPATQLEDRRRAELFTQFFGSAKKAAAISLGEWEQFIALRRSGAIDSHGRSVAVKNRRPVRDRTIEADLTWLKATLNWGTKWRVCDGAYLLADSPVRGFELPREKNPKRPIVTQDRFEKIRRVSDQVMMQVPGGRRRDRQRSHLSELLDLVHGTGRRVSAVLQLTYADLRLAKGPHGSIRWPADTDKMGREAVVPIGPDARAAIDRVLRDRPGIGKAPLFPSPRDPSKSVRYERASQWLLEAERLAEVPKQDQGLWHPYRRAWATSRKHLPDVDVAAAGGWASPATLQMCYQLPDQDTMLRVVLEGGQLRSVSGDE